MVEGTKRSATTGELCARQKSICFNLTPLGRRDRLSVGIRRLPVTSGLVLEIKFPISRQNKVVLRLDFVKRYQVKRYTVDHMAPGRIACQSFEVS